MTVRPSGRMTRKEFLRRAGIGAAAVGAVAMGLSRTAKAQQTQNLDPNITPNGTGGYDVYPTGSQTTVPHPDNPANTCYLDLRNVQWALSNADPGATIVLKRTSVSGAETPFFFGIVPYPPSSGDTNMYYLVARRDVTITGEVSLRDPKGWILGGTKIIGGTQNLMGVRADSSESPPVAEAKVSVTIKDIIFDSFKAGAVKLVATHGYNEISGCSFLNGQMGQTVPGGDVTGMFPIIVHGGTGLKGIESLGGTLKVAKNYFGAPGAPYYFYGNLMHFTDCNYSLLEISDNKIADCVWIGFVASGVRGKTIITRNDITKTRSYLIGPAIGSGPDIAGYFSSLTYGGDVEITDNVINIYPNPSDPYKFVQNSSGIVVGAFPKAMFDNSPPDPVYVVTGNVINIISNGNNRFGHHGMAAISIIGDCRDFVVAGNKITGKSDYGILMSNQMPQDPLAPGMWQPVVGDAYLLNNNISGNDLSGFTANVAQMYLDGFSQGNYAGPGTFDGKTYAGNVFGSPGTGQASLICEGSKNHVEYNNFVGLAPGWTDTSSGPGCILLTEGTRGNYIRGNTFPTGTICTQIMDLDMQLGSVGLPQGSQDAIPGYGVCQRNPAKAQEVQNALDNQQAALDAPPQETVDPAELGLVWNPAKQRWELPQQ